MALQIYTFVLGPLDTNCYVLRWGRECWIVDVSLWASDMVEFFQREKLTPGRILLTHGHADHIAGVGEIRAAFPNVRVCCPAGDEYMLNDPVANVSAAYGLKLTCPPADDLLQPGQVLSADGLDWQVLDTSGHTPGGVTFYCPQEHVALTGDALFHQSIGRTDIPNASENLLVQNLRRCLLILPPDTRVLPGHGEETTIGLELANNPYL